MAIRKKVNFGGFVGIFVLFMFIPVAEAEQPIDITYCLSLTGSNYSGNYSACRIMPIK